MNFNLKQNVQGENLLNKTIMQELQNLLPQLQKYVGKRILTQTGKSAKFIIEHIKVDNFRCYLDTSAYSIWLKADVCTQGEPDKNGNRLTTYFKKEIYLGKMKSSGELESIEDFDSICKNWKLNEVIEEQQVFNTIEKYKQLKAELDIIYNDFPIDKNFLKY